MCPIRRGVTARRRFAAAIVWGMVLALSAQSSYAARWSAVGRAEGAATGRVYIDLDSIQEDGGYRIAVFLTIYLRVVTNASGFRMDRFTQQTAFDCGAGTAALISTVAYLHGKEVAQSSDNPDWKTQLRAIPANAQLSQRAYELACKATPVLHPSADDSAISAATVVLPPLVKAPSSAPPAPH
jgi:hypothetical protein